MSKMFLVNLVGYLLGHLGVAENIHNEISSDAPSSGRLQLVNDLSPCFLPDKMG